MIEDQALSSSYDWAPYPTPFILSLQQVVSLCQSSCVSPVELTDGRGGGGGGLGDKSPVLYILNCCKPNTFSQTFAQKYGETEY
jgi:hypothetical protein